MVPADPDAVRVVDWSIRGAAGTTSVRANLREAPVTQAADVRTDEVCRALLRGFASGHRVRMTYDIARDANVMFNLNGLAFAFGGTALLTGRRPSLYDDDFAVIEREQQTDDDASRSGSVEFRFGDRVPGLRSWHGLLDAVRMPRGPTDARLVDIEKQLSSGRRAGETFLDSELTIAFVRYGESADVGAGTASVDHDGRRYVWPKYETRERRYDVACVVRVDSAGIERLDCVMVEDDAAYNEARAKYSGPIAGAGILAIFTSIGHRTINVHRRCRHKPTFSSPTSVWIRHARP